MPHSSPESRPHPNRSLFILSTAALAFALAQTTLIPALGDLKERLDTDASGVAWTLTGYLIAAAVFTPLFGRLVQGFGGGIFPLCFGIIRDEFPRERVGQSIGLISATLGIGGGVGLVVG